MGSKYCKGDESRLIPKLDGFSYIYFVCEGANEESVVRWMDENKAMFLDPTHYSLEFCRCRSKKGKEKLASRIKEMDYDGEVGVIYICDSPKEEWKLPKKEIGKEIPVFRVITKQEIEILLILSDPVAYRQWNGGKKKQMKASEFARQYFKRDIKNGEEFKSIFSDFDEFIKTCFKYKKRSNRNDGFPCLFDLLNDEYTNRFIGELSS